MPHLSLYVAQMLPLSDMYLFSPHWNMSQNFVSFVHYRTRELGQCVAPSLSFSHWFRMSPLSCTTFLFTYWSVWGLVHLHMNCYIIINYYSFIYKIWDIDRYGNIAHPSLDLYTIVLIISAHLFFCISFGEFGVLNKTSSSSSSLLFHFLFGFLSAWESHLVLYVHF